MEELSAIYPVKTQHEEMYEAAISEEPHSFWYVNLVATAKDDMFFARFEHTMILEYETMIDPTSNLSSVQADSVLIRNPKRTSYTDVTATLRSKADKATTYLKNKLTADPKSMHFSAH